MEGLKYRFTVSGVGTLTKESTDFLVDYGASGNPQSLQVSLLRVWEQINPAVFAYDRRKALEDRVKLIMWTYRNQRGTLDIARQSDATWGGAGSASFADCKLVDVKWNQAQKNGWIDYDLVFDYAVGGEIARTLVFDAKVLNARAFIVKHDVEDRTAFKLPFRAAPVRIPGGPGLQKIDVTGILQDITGASAVARRQAVEAVIKEWAWTKKGVSGTLTIDGISKGTCHLQNVSPSDMNLLDAVAFDLSFATGYVE